MDRNKHNHNYIGIQFVQIGNSSLAELRDLTEGEYGVSLFNAHILTLSTGVLTHLVGYG